jgi:hypothetical protein
VESLYELLFNSKYFILRKLNEIDKYGKIRLRRILSQEIIEGNLDLKNNQFIANLDLKNNQFIANLDLKNN